jgi:crotonobetainyl-CoA:carnitine CoA-transferase CaiB-like acyl-CoA transferase
MADQTARPLQGIRVLDLATMIAAPYCASILGEFGAEVIKVEMPGKGDPFRTFGTMMESGKSLNWLNDNRNKKSVTLDLRRPEGVELLKKLTAASDVVVENFRPGTLERWGLGPDTLKAVKPELILVRISAYGQDGPYRERPGYARIAHGFAGLSYLAGEPSGPPVVPGSTSLADYISGLYAALGTLLALIARDRFKVGQAVDVALYEGVFRMLDEIAPAYAKSGYVRERMGTETVNAVPHSHYQTADGRWVALACSSDKMFARLAAVMDRMDLLAPGRFAAVRDREASRDEVNGIVSAWIGSRALDQVMRECLAGDVPIGPINSIADIFADEHFRARKNLIEIDEGSDGTVVVPNVVPRLSVTPGQVDTLGPALGQHNDDVYRDLLGLQQHEIQTLQKAGVI